jgi:hypothetical protein
MGESGIHFPNRVRQNPGDAVRYRLLFGDELDWHRIQVHRQRRSGFDGYLRYALAEWESNDRALPDLVPILVVASAITVVGYGLTTWLVWLWKPRRSRVFAASAATALLLLLLAEISTGLHIWHAPFIWYNLVQTFLRVVVPMALLAGVLALARNRLNA